MSTLRPPGATFKGQARPRWEHLSPKRGLIFIAVVVGLIVIIALNYEIIWDILAELVPIILEVAEKILDGAFELVGMAPGTAQMVTAYVGVVAGLALLYFLARKTLIWALWFKETAEDYQALYAHLIGVWLTDTRRSLIVWWNNLDWLGKVGAVVGGVLILIPVLLLISVSLGMIVALTL